MVGVPDPGSLYTDLRPDWGLFRTGEHQHTSSDSLLRPGLSGVHSVVHTRSLRGDVTEGQLGPSRGGRVPRTSHG